ncbi:MAG: hypothetical protein R6V45_02295 [Oceanipulchritudo sp.]
MNGIVLSVFRIIYPVTLPVQVAFVPCRSFVWKLTCFSLILKPGMKKNTFLLLVLCCAFSGGSAFAAETSPLPQTGGKKSRYARPHEAGIRILTYNIRNCRGMDGKVDFDRIAGVIDSINPDYVALQEVDRHTP